MANTKKANVAETKIDTTDSKVANENKELKKRLAEMEEMLKTLTENKKDKPEDDIIQIEEDKYEEIPMQKPIKVMSLFAGGLNLKTSNDSTAQIFRFTFVGQTYPIIYSDLIKIMATQRDLFQKGYCMILDKSVIKSHYLEDYYKKFVDGKVINNILDYDNNKIREIFSNVTPTIQQSIVDVIINKINSNDYVDKNKVSVINDIYGKNIFDLASKMK
jgi:hypothetical protein